MRAVMQIMQDCPDQSDILRRSKIWYFACEITGVAKMKITDFLRAVNGARHVGIALENNRKPSQKHLKDLGIHEVYNERFGSK